MEIGRMSWWLHSGRPKRKPALANTTSRWVMIMRIRKMMSVRMRTWMRTRTGTGKMMMVRTDEDEDELVAALRETEEEAGIDKHHLDVLL